MRISNRDWVQLSAYLDGELSTREVKKLEARLGSEPEVRAALDDLKRTKHILSRTPTLKVPRNFTLSAQQAGIRRSRAPAVGYSWAAAVLSFLFIAVVVVDLGTGSLKGSLPAAGVPRAEEALPQAAMEAAPAADAVEEPALLAAEESVESQNAADQEAEMAQEAAAPAAEVGATGEVGAVEEENLPEEAAQDVAEGQAKTAPEESDRAAEPGTDGAASSESGEDGGAAPAPTAEAEIESYYEVIEEETPTRVVQPAIPWIRILEVLLGLGAAGFTSAAWIRRRRRS
jgi:hypothetical protein